MAYLFPQVEVHRGLFLAVTRITATFDKDGTPATEAGTAFWMVGPKGNRYLVTNRHVLDRKLGRNLDGFRLNAIEVDVRRRELPVGPEWAYCSVAIEDVSPKCVRMHPTADCAVIVDPPLAPFSEDFELPPRMFTTHDMPDESAFESMSAGSSAFFLGFASGPNKPGGGSVGWWDTYRYLPVLRVADIASPPGWSFKNKEIATDDVVLVAGMSFGGASGSPVFTASSASFPRVLGIMSGHLEGEPATFPPAHSGLSYFTRATAIAHLICDDWTGG